MDMKLEVVSVHVADVDRAKQFYKELGWREDADFPGEGGYRVVQMTPPGSPTSVHFGTGTVQPDGPVQGVFLAVSDIEAARAELAAHGAQVSEVFHDAHKGPLRADPAARVSGPHPQRLSYASYATFSDPDGNTWVLQEITTRLPGR